MNDMCVVCSVFHFGCMGGIFGYVFIPLEIEENMETTSWFTILCSVIVYEVWSNVLVQIFIGERNAVTIMVE